MSLPKLFGNVRPGLPPASERGTVMSSRDIIDYRRHPKVYEYVDYSIRWSASTLTRYVGLWNAGYQRFGDEFEAALQAHPERTQKPTELAAALVQNLADPWMVIGHRFEEFSADKQYWWSRCLSKDYEQFLPLLMKTDPPDRALAEWAGYKLRYGGYYAKATDPNSWAKAVHATVMERHGNTTVNTISREPLLDGMTVEDLMAFVESGVSPKRYARTVKAHRWTMAGLQMHLTQGIPLEYALVL